MEVNSRDEANFITETNKQVCRILSAYSGVSKKIKKYP